MLYKKYVIEVVYETKVIENITIQSNNSYETQIQMNFTPIEKIVNTIKFLAEDGQIQEYECFFDTHKEALNVLSTHYYSTRSDTNVLTLKIVTVYDDIVPPVEVLRAMKIKNILD